MDPTIGKRKTGKRGFASMDKAKRSLIAGNGGRKAHKMGKAHTWTSAEARTAGKIGGKRSSRRASKPSQ